MTSDGQARAAHIDHVRADHCRSAFERATSKLAYYDNWERHAAAGEKLPMDENDSA